MRVSIRKFNGCDIENKIKWINNPANNRYLHYDLPLEYDRTVKWFENNKNRNDRYDAVIEADGTPIGIIGILNIDFKNLKGEFYICIGETGYKGKGLAFSASQILLDHAFTTLKLNKVYLYTEKDNTVAQRLFEKMGFKREGLLEEDLIYNKRKVDRFAYGITAKEFENRNIPSVNTKF